MVATDVELGRWLAQEFTRHFPEVQGLDWPEPAVEAGDVVLELDLARGMTAWAADITVTLRNPGEPRLFTTDAFELGGVRHSLSTVVAQCSQGSVELGSVPLNGVVKGFLADAEVWSLVSGGPDQTALGEQADLGDVEVGQMVADGGDEDAALAPLPGPDRGMGDGLAPR